MASNHTQLVTTQLGPSAKKLPATRPTVAGFLPFGEGDLFPQNLIDAVDDSDTATAAMQARAEFIIGNGIEHQELADLVVNPHGETLDEVAEGIAWNVAYGEVICLLVGYNGNGKVVSVRSVSWDQVRLAIPDQRGKLTHAGVFPFLDNSFQKDKKTEFTLLPLFNPDPVVVQQQIAQVGGIQNYYGQLLYAKVGRPSADYYSIPSWFGTVKNLETEKELTDFDLATVLNGFNISGIWKELGDPNSDEDEEDDEDSTAYKLSENQGGENGGKVVVVKAPDVEALKAMDFVPTTGANLADRYNSTNERVMQRIARRMRTPNELVGIRKQGGIAPTGEEMKVATKIMQQTVNKYQRRIDQTLAKVMTHWFEPLPGSDYKLENLDYFTDTPSTDGGNPTQPPTIASNPV